MLNAGIEAVVKTNFKAYQKQLKDRQKLILKAERNAAFSTVLATRKVVIREGRKVIKDPIPALFNERKGWIFVDVDKTAEAKSKGFVQAKVYIKGKGRNKDELKAQQEIAHRNIYGTTVKNAPIAIPYIIKPSKRLLNSRIKGVPMFVDRHGNIKFRGFKNYVDGVYDLLNNPEHKGKFFEIKLGEKSHNKLPPGLYQRLTYKKRKTDYKKNSETGKRRGPYTKNGKRDGKQVATFVISILQYYRIRDYKRKWKFKEPAIKFMQAKYSKEFIREFDKAIDKQRDRTPSGDRKTGTLLPV